MGEAKNLITRMSGKGEILWLAPQNDIITPSHGEGGHMGRSASGFKDRIRWKT